MSDNNNDFLKFDKELIDAAKFIYDGDEDQLPPDLRDEVLKSKGEIIDADFKELSEEEKLRMDIENYLMNTIKEGLKRERWEVNEKNINKVIDDLVDGKPRYDIFERTKPRPMILLKKPIYEQQLAETQIYYQQFLTYASIPLENRNVAETWRRWCAERRSDKGINDDGSMSKTSRVFYEVAKHWRWDERASALEVARLRLQEQKWIERDMERREADWEAAEQLRDKAIEALSKLSEQELSTGVIARYIELASNIQQRTIPQLQLSGRQVKDLLASADEQKRGEVIRILMAEIKR